MMDGVSVNVIGSTVPLTSIAGAAIGPVRVNCIEQGRRICGWEGEGEREIERERER